MEKLVFATQNLIEAYLTKNIVPPDHFLKGSFSNKIKVGHQIL